MKKLNSILLCLFFFVAANTVTGTSFHVNNQTGTSDGSNGIYKEIQGAHDVALDGDTLIIDGTSDTYQSATIRKKLVISGPGYFQNENPSTNTFPAYVNSIFLRESSGGDVTTGAAGSIIQGLDFSRRSFGGVDVFVNNVTIRKCRIISIFLGWSSNVSSQVNNTIISQNYFIEISSSNITTTSFGFLQNAIITNNIFEGIVEVPENSTVDFLHNLFLASQFNIENIAGVVRNNIFLSNSPTYDLSADQVTHNISLGSGLPLGNGNIRNAQGSSIFLLNPVVNGSDGQYQLSSNSVAKGTGYNGVDIGPYGGNTPYTTYGIGEIPVIWFLNISETINPSQNLTVNVRAVSGN